jgi:hypothetical protein
MNLVTFARCALLGAATLSSDGAGGAATPPLHVAVHLDASRAGPSVVRHMAGGVLFGGADGLSPQPRHASQLVQPLRINMVRCFLSAAECVKSARSVDLSAAGEVQWIMSNAWTRQAAAGSLPGDGGDWQPWRRFVHNAVMTLETLGANRSAVLLDVWNEPNFFNDTQWTQFLEAWRQAHLIVNGRFHLAGPSTASAYYKGRLSSFVEYVALHKVAPSVLTWHELGDTSGRLLPVKIAQVRSLLANHSIDAEISINEIIPSTNAQYPGTLLSYFAALEAAKVRSAAHSCWGDCGGANCPLSHLDGLLTCDGQPRPIWWVYRWYAGLRGGLRMTGSSNVSSPYRSADMLGAALGGSVDHPARIEALVGYFGFPGDTMAAAGGSVCVTGVPAAWGKTVGLTIELVGLNTSVNTNQNTSALMEPVVLHSGPWVLNLSGTNGCGYATTVGWALYVPISPRWGVRVQDVLRLVIQSVEV